MKSKLRDSGQCVCTRRAKSCVARKVMFPTSLFIAALGALALAGCGSGSPAGAGPTGDPGTGGTPAIAARLSPSGAQAIDDGQIMNIAAILTNDSSGKGATWSMSGVGTLSNETTTATAYNAPASGGGTATITATSVADTTKTASLTITVTAAPAITSTSLPADAEGTAYNQTVAASGGAGTLTFSLSSGALPAGLTMSGAGAITGTPSGPNGASNFTAKVTDSSGAGPQSSTQALSITINEPPAPTITTSSLPAGVEGAAYSQTVQVSGGLNPFTFTINAGTLPGGLNMSNAGVISGAPSGPDGTANFIVKVTDTSNPTQSATQSLSITVNLPPPPTITTTSLPGGTVGVNYNQTLAGTCPSSATLGACTWRISSGALPAGLSLNSGSGAITGKPTGPASGIPVGFTVSYTDKATPQQLTTQSLSMTISNPTDPCAGVTDAGNESLLNGSYAFLLKGFDDGTGSGETSQEPALIGGVLTFNGLDNNGLITAGTLDMNLNGTGGVQSNAITSGAGSYYVMDASDASHRRVCMSITTAAGTQHYRASLGNITGGVASTGHMVGFDASGQFTAGTLRRQTATSLSDGNYAFGVSSAQNDAWCNSSGACGGKFAAAGVFQFAGGAVNGGALDDNSNGLLDDNSANTTWPTTAESINSGGTYSFASNGRGTLTFTPGGSASAAGAVLYAVSSTDALILGSDDQTLNNLFGGEMLQQIGGPFANSALSGTSIVYFSSLNQGTPSSSNVTIGRGTTDGAGNFTAGTLWQNNSGTISSQALSGTTYSADPSGNGRALMTGSSPRVFWMVSANEAFMLGSSGSVESGMLEPQTSTSAPTATYAFGTIHPEDLSNDDNLGVTTFSGGNVSGTTDDNSSGIITVNQTFGPSGVSVDSTGLGSIGAAGCTVGGTGSSGCPQIFYTISSKRAVLLNLLDGQGNAQTNTALQVADQ